MALTNINFLLFVLIITILYFTLFKKKQWILLLIASIIFYLFSGPKYIIYILFTSFITWFIALRIMDRHNKEKAFIASNDNKEEIKSFKKKNNKIKKLWLILYLIIVVGILSVIKYSNFALNILNSILIKYNLSLGLNLNFVLPLGISFYTFMVISYILDVYWKRYEASNNFFKVLLFAIYFPHITQGPLDRFNKLDEQFNKTHEFDYDRICKGFQLILWGMFEKLVIADRLAIFVDGVYSSWQITPRVPIIIAFIFFSIRLYMDFEGCMNIGIGASEIFGIEIDKNFNHPYFSTSMPEFWTRWHITLGKWFKDYILYPVTMSKLCKNINRFTKEKWGNKISRILATIIPTSTVWLITGIWHGAAYNYIAWGIYHGILVMSSTIFEEPIRKLTSLLRINTETFSFRLFRMIRTFILSSLGRVFFMAYGIKDAIRLVLYLFFGKNLGIQTIVDGSMYNFGLDRYNYLLCWILILIIIVVAIIQEKGIIIRDFIAEQNLIFRWILYMLLIFSIIIFGIYGPGYDAANFVYGVF